MKNRKRKANSRSASVFQRFPMKCEKMADDDVSLWIDVALDRGATFYVGYGGQTAEMHTNVPELAQEGIFRAFLAYAKAHPKQFVGALYARAKEKPFLTQVYPLDDQEACGYRYLVRAEKR